MSLWYRPFSYYAFFGVRLEFVVHVVTGGAVRGGLWRPEKQTPRTRIGFKVVTGHGACGLSRQKTSPDDLLPLMRRENIFFSPQSLVPG